MSYKLGAIRFNRESIGKTHRESHVKFKAKELTKRLTGIQRVSLRHKIKSLYDIRLLCAVANNNTHAVEELLAFGVSPNCADVHGRSLLHIAASKGYTDVLRLLLEKGANPNQCDNLNNTPLHLAACTHNLAIISMLLKAGADATKLDLYGKNPLHLAQGKLQLLNRSWRQGSIEFQQIRVELQHIVDILLSVISQSEELQLIKCSLESPRFDYPDEMSNLLEQLEGFQI